MTNLSSFTVFCQEAMPGFSPDVSSLSLPEGRHFTLLPGFADVHVHFREPGFSYKETVRTGSMAAARGGFTDVLAMPNLSPVADSLEHLAEERSIIRRDAAVRVHPYAALTVNEAGETLTDLEALRPLCVAFSDDGKGVQQDDLMREAMRRVKKAGGLIAAHCEVNELLRGGYIHDGEYAKEYGHKGISSESEWRMVERDLRLAEETGCPYHVCHVSTKESVRLIREAKARGADVTCETAPHYLLLDENDLEEDGRFKMNPPLRAQEDRTALLEGLKDGTIDMIATDHAPHSAEEKSRGLQGSAFGIVGLETAFPLLYTYLVRTGTITPEKLLALLVTNPRKRFGLPEVQSGDFSVWDLSEVRRIDPKDFLSMGKATPFEGWSVYGRNYLTVCGGKEVFRENTTGEQ